MSLVQTELEEAEKLHANALKMPTQYGVSILEFINKLTHVKEEVKEKKSKKSK